MQLNCSYLTIELHSINLICQLRPLSNLPSNDAHLVDKS